MTVEDFKETWSNICLCHGNPKTYWNNSSGDVS